MLLQIGVWLLPPSLSSSCLSGSCFIGKYMYFELCALFLETPTQNKKHITMIIQMRAKK